MANDRTERLPFEILRVLATVRDLQREVADLVADRRLDGTRHAALAAALGELEQATESLGRATRHVRRGTEPHVAAASRERRRRAPRGADVIEPT